MTFHPLAHNIVKTLTFKSVCEFGNQRYTGPGAFRTTKDFYASLGCHDYIALDVNEQKDAVIADLNLPVYHILKRRYELVTNNGTGEHIFDQMNVFRNAHVLSSRFMLHILPMAPWVNHGFFNYNPILFRDLAYANGYKSKVFIANRWGTRAELEDNDLYKEKHPKTLEAAVNEIAKEADVFVVALFEKAKEVTTFKRPFQGKYQKDIEDKALRSRYQ